MNVLRLAFLGCLVAGLVGCGTTTSAPSGTPSIPKGYTPTSTPPKAVAASNNDKIVGKWEVTKAEEGPTGAISEYNKGGKLTITMKGPDNKEVSVPGPDEVGGDKPPTAMKVGDKEQKQTLTITKLTDTEM